MADVIRCPSCDEPVSRNAIECRSCGGSIVPDSITIELLDSLPDEDLPDFLFHYASKVFEEHDCWRIDGPRAADILATLPRGIRAGYTLVDLDSEVRNGGFYQYFTNSSGQIAYEALEDLRLIGAKNHALLVQQAIQLNEQLEAKYPWYKQRWESPESDIDAASKTRFWADVETNFEPEFDRLSSDFYSLDDTDSLWNQFRTYARTHPNECVHRRG
jgi:hypothetical protein